MSKLSMRVVMNEYLSETPWLGCGFQAKPESTNEKIGFSYQKGSYMYPLSFTLSPFGGSIVKGSDLTTLPPNVPNYEWGAQHTWKGSFQINKLFRLTATGHCISDVGQWALSTNSPSMASIKPQFRLRNPHERPSVPCWNIQGRLSRPKFEFPYMIYKYVHGFYRLATGLGATLQ